MRQFFSTLVEKVNSPLLNHFVGGEPYENSPSIAENGIKAGNYNWVATSNDKEAIRRLFVAENGALTSVAALSFRINQLGENARRVAFLSADNGMEAASMAVMIGRHMAKESLRIACVDMAVTQPSISRLLDEENLGLNDLLTNQAEFLEIIYGDDKSTLNIIPCGKARLTAEALFAAHNLNYVLDALTCSYDRIVMDFGALNSRFFADKIASVATTVVIVGSGNIRHQNLIDLYTKYTHSERIELMVIMADATLS
jgi:Mrp family chromosome partitioning ATPase